VFASVVKRSGHVVNIFYRGPSGLAGRQDVRERKEHVTNLNPALQGYVDGLIETMIASKYDLEKDLYEIARVNNRQGMYSQDDVLILLKGFKTRLDILVTNFNASFDVVQKTIQNTKKE
jgi:hypothetical protein